MSNINSHGLSKPKEVDVLNVPGATSADVLIKMDNVLNKKPTSLNGHVGINYLQKLYKSVIKCKKNVNQTNKTFLNTVLTFSKITCRKYSDRYQFSVKQFLSAKHDHIDI